MILSSLSLLLSFFFPLFFFFKYLYGGQENNQVIYTETKRTLTVLVSVVKNKSINAVFYEYYSGTLRFTVLGLHGNFWVAEGGYMGAFVRSCQKLPLSLQEPVLYSSNMDPTLLVFICLIYLGFVCLSVTYQLFHALPLVSILINEILSS